MCDNNGDKIPREPQEIAVTSGVHFYVWAIPDACGRPIQAHALEEPIAADEETEDDDDDGEESPTQDLDLPISSRRRYSIFTILFLSIAAIAGVAYLIARPPPALQRLSSHLPALPIPHISQRRMGLSFRTGEGSLVKWAATDMLGGDDEEGDQFINARQDSDIESGEDIPLTPSPTKRGKHGRGLFGTRYGSVSM